MTKLRLTLAIGMIAAAAAPASADYCSTNQSSYDAVQQLEDIASKPKAKLTFPEYARCLAKPGRPFWRDKTLHRRAAKACETILAADASHRACLDYSAMRGERKVGNVDIVSAIAARPIDPWKLFTGHGGVENEEDPTYVFLARFNVTSSAAVVMHAWDANTAKGMKLKADSPEKHAWNEWRMVATTLLVRIGGKTEKEFLEMKLTGIKSEGHAKLTELVEEAIERLDR